MTNMPLLRILRVYEWRETATIKDAANTPVMNLVGRDELQYFDTVHYAIGDPAGWRRAEEPTRVKAERWPARGIRVSPWKDENNGNFAYRYELTGDPTQVACRVAAIEKSPRVRISPYDTFENESLRWHYGPKGNRDLMAMDPNSRAWCDAALEKMGFILTSEFPTITR